MVNPNFKAVRAIGARKTKSAASYPMCKTRFAGGFDIMSEKQLGPAALDDGAENSSSTESEQAQGPGFRKESRRIAIPGVDS